LGAKSFRRSHTIRLGSTMIVGLTKLAVLTIIAIVEVWKTSGMQLENED
jgi:hypothetical protein